jgi:hypothetical protein
VSFGVGVLGTGVVMVGRVRLKGPGKRRSRRRLPSSRSPAWLYVLAAFFLSLDSTICVSAAPYRTILG